MFLCRTLALLSKSAVLLLWTALKKSTSDFPTLCPCLAWSSWELCSVCLGRGRYSSTSLAGWGGSSASFMIFLCHLQQTTHHMRASYARRRLLGHIGGPKQGRRWVRITGEEGGKSPDTEKCAGRQAVSLLIVQNKDFFFFHVWKW